MVDWSVVLHILLTGQQEPAWGQSLLEFSQSVYFLEVTYKIPMQGLNLSSYLPEELGQLQNLDSLWVLLHGTIILISTAYQVRTSLICG